MHHFSQSIPNYVNLSSPMLIVYLLNVLITGPKECPQRLDPAVLLQERRRVRKALREQYFFNKHPQQSNYIQVAQACTDASARYFRYAASFIGAEFSSFSFCLFNHLCFIIFLKVFALLSFSLIFLIAFLYKQIAWLLSRLQFGSLPPFVELDNRLVHNIHHISN